MHAGRRIGVLPAESRDEDALGGLFARAFHEDPLFAHLIPDPHQRSEVLPVFFWWNVHYGLLYGDVLRTEEVLAGAAVMLRPADDHFSDDRLAESGYQRIASALGASWRSFDSVFSQVFGHCDQILHEATDASDWYLDVLGVDRDQQGVGIGAELLRSINTRADDAMAAVSLLTFTESNLRFYRRHGYTIACDGIEPSSGLRFWGTPAQRRNELTARPARRTSNWPNPPPSGSNPTRARRRRSARRRRIERTSA